MVVLGLFLFYINIHMNIQNQFIVELVHLYDVTLDITITMA